MQYLTNVANFIVSKLSALYRSVGDFVIHTNNVLQTANDIRISPFVIAYVFAAIILFGLGCIIVAHRQRILSLLGIKRDPYANLTVRQQDGLRWLRQAKCDLKAVDHDLVGEAYEWVCFKCQQATEKSLKSLLIFHGLGNDVLQSHDLTKIVSQLRHRELETLTRQLHGIVGFVGRTRYPDSLSIPNIPHDIYSKMDALTSIELAVKIVKLVEELLHTYSYNDNNRSSRSRNAASHSGSSGVKIGGVRRVNHFNQQQLHYKQL